MSDDDQEGLGLGGKTASVIGGVVAGGAVARGVGHHRMKKLPEEVRTYLKDELPKAKKTAEEAFDKDHPKAEDYVKKVEAEVENIKKGALPEAIKQPGNAALAAHVEGLDAATIHFKGMQDAEDKAVRNHPKVLEEMKANGGDYSKAREKHQVEVNKAVEEARAKFLKDHPVEKADDFAKTVKARADSLGEEAVQKAAEKETRFKAHLDKKSAAEIHTAGKTDHVAKALGSREETMIEKIAATVKDGEKTMEATAAKTEATRILKEGKAYAEAGFFGKPWQAIKGKGAGGKVLVGLGLVGGTAASYLLLNSMFGGRREQGYAAQVTAQRAEQNNSPSRG